MLPRSFSIAGVFTIYQIRKKIKIPFRQGGRIYRQAVR
jgi:hypothetical protein